MSPIENHTRSLMMVLSHTQKKWADYMRRAALTTGMPESYRMIVMFLRRHPGATQKELAELTAKTTPAINHTVKELLADGIVRKEADPFDARYTHLYLTDMGLAYAERIRELLHIADGKITEFLTPEKERELQALLEALGTFIEKEL